MHLDDKKALVIGAGQSGIAAAEFMVAKGAAVTLTDTKPMALLGDKVSKLATTGVKLVLGEPYPDPAREGYHFLVVSPGVPLTVPPVVKAYQAGIPVIGELELAFRFAVAPIVAITGTNGKTTTTSLLGDIFKENGWKTLVAGNIGRPLVKQVEHYDADDVIVAEVSSFQLETIQTFRPHVAVILNITPDHLDRHLSMENYIRAKAQIFSNQVPLDFTILNYEDQHAAALAKQSLGKVIFFSTRHILEEGVYIQQGNIMVSLDGNVKNIMPVNEIKIPGQHNLENVLATVACASVMGVSPDTLRKTLRNFKGVAHRLELVAEINGIKYINDSKGTNPDASIKALEAYDVPIVLIAGGKNKGSDFTQLAAKIKERVRLLILLGQHRYEIRQAVERQGFTNLIMVADYTEAVAVARREARPGEVVLLSPACASWDMFKNYQQRGDLFRDLVLNLRG